MTTWTDKVIQKAVRDAKASDTDVWLTDTEKARGVGRLRLRARISGHVMFYYRYTGPGSKQAQLHLGVYDINGKAGLTLAEAVAKAGEYTLLYKAGNHDLHAYLKRQEAEEAARIKAAAQAREEAERQAKSGSLKALLDGYVAHLTSRKKQSARDVENLVRRNVYDEFPHLATKRAADIVLDDVSEILARAIERGAGRSAGKLRSYIRAAYTLALGAKGNPTVHPNLHGFCLTANPAALVASKGLAEFNKAVERVLNVSELHAFLKELGKRSGVIPDAIMLGLLLGGQRPTQLLRVRPADADMDGRTLTLLDPKGARQNARVHLLPLTDRAAEIVERLLTVNGEKDFLFTSTGKGKVPVRGETLTKAVAEISAAMVKDKTAREPFSLRDLRRTCETMLASMGISKDVRAQLLSHGLGGVQNVHYDKHDYADEKRNALEAWGNRLEEITSGKHQAKNVVVMKRKVAA